VFVGVLFGQRVFPINAERKALYLPYHRLTGACSFALGAAGLVTGFAHVQDMLIAQGTSVRAMTVMFANYLGVAAIWVLVLTTYTLVCPRRANGIGDMIVTSGHAIDATAKAHLV
jgi:hypothetical protein